MAHLYLQGLQLLVLLIVKSECRDILPKTVFASKEEDIVLPCFENYRTTSCYRVKLIKYATDASQMKVILARPKIPKLKDAERVKWDADRNVSLFLTKTQLSDEGLYGCEIWQGWDCIHVKNISIKVRDCKTLQAVKASPGSPVNLNCPVNVTSGQQGPQNISWAMLKGVENVTVATVPGLTTSEIILETKMEGSSRAFIAVLVASVIVGIAIMAALIGLFIYRRRNTRRVTQQTQRHTPGTLSDVYEIVDLTPSEDHTNNCLYQQSLDEGLCTFRYQ
ncbi:uncharacterized protein LOC116386358 isoform X2 [Anarrhichthys ocellatus]|uniref:uncharacterized protein LOC116386358 isoform X2 n=1 Tax=Anarrhichthys ocellatus TaxID=433405 RepID=UPI0012EE8CDE|nr:uncharacterized protein LOC116386358 isoform X2 [Anarrhichthys ocellatus]